MKADFTPFGMLGWSAPAEIFTDGDGVAPIRWTVPIVYAAMEAGVLYEGARYELVRGQLLRQRKADAPLFYYAKDIMADALITVFGDRCARGRGVLRISEETGEPEVLVTRRLREFRKAHPTPADALLVGEIAEGMRGFLLPQVRRH